MPVLDLTPYQPFGANVLWGCVESIIYFPGAAETVQREEHQMWWVVANAFEMAKRHPEFERVFLATLSQMGLSGFKVLFALPRFNEMRHRKLQGNREKGIAGEILSLIVSMSMERVQGNLDLIGADIPETRAFEPGLHKAMKILRREMDCQNRRPITIRHMQRAWSQFKAISHVILAYKLMIENEPPWDRWDEETFRRFLATVEFYQVFLTLLPVGLPNRGGPLVSLDKVWRLSGIPDLPAPSIDRIPALECHQRVWLREMGDK